MLNKILNLAEKYKMFPKGASVVCGLSGGADSVCLTVCLIKLSNRLGINVEALHVNHCLRGDESDRDEQFCRSLCEKLGISFTAVSCDVKSYANTASLSLEEAARKMRYDAFSRHSSGKLIATAHNADDNLETAILNLSRGSGIKGIAGIPPIRGNIVRPLLAVTRAEIEEYLNVNKLPHVVDSTNLADDCTRNKIRHSILPALAEIYPSVTEVFINSSDTLRDENSFIECETNKALSKCRNGNILYGIGSYHPVIRRRCIARLLTDNSLSYSHERLMKCDYIATNGGKLNIHQDIYLVSDGKFLELRKISASPEYEPISKEMIIGDNSIFKGKILRTDLISDKNLHPDSIVNTKLAIYYLDYDKIIGRAFVRNRRFGDKIKLSGRGFTSSVKKLINEKIPPELRSKLCFIEDDDGTVFAEGIGIADRVSPDENTQSYLKITIISN